MQLFGQPLFLELNMKKTHLVRFVLQLVVLGGVGFVLATLTGVFWAYFMYLWKTWESGKKEAILGPGPYHDSRESLHNRDDHQKSKTDLSKGMVDDLSQPELNQVIK